MGCSSDDTPLNNPVEELPKNTVDLEINGTTIEDEVINISSFYSCNERLFVSVSSKYNGVTSELFTITILKTGEIISAAFYNKLNGSRTNYRTADFIPGSTITIEEFEFVENEKLNIKLSGQLLKQTYNYSNTSETIDINGTISILKFSVNNCNVYPDYIELNNEISFLNISRKSQGYNQDRLVQYESFSLDGYQIVFNNFNESLKDMPLGTYNFNDLGNSQKIEFAKYTGPPRNFSTSFLIPTDWKTYNCDGSFTIVENAQIDGFNVTTVTMNFTASYNGVIEYTFTNALFKTSL
jgi:hypothetical protein